MKVKSIGVLGKKLGMTQILDQDGALCGVTVVDFSSMFVLGTRSLDRDGYMAVILGCEKASKGNGFQYVCEMKMNDTKLYDDDSFLENLKNLDKVDVTALSKGKGFQGAMKRWNFGGGPASHGSKTHRRVGSIGQCTFPAKVVKGKKMPGRMGGSKVTILNQRLLKVDIDRKVVFIEGSIPGPKEGFVAIRDAIKG